MFILRDSWRGSLFSTVSSRSLNYPVHRNGDMGGGVSPDSLLSALSGDVLAGHTHSHSHILTHMLTLTHTLTHTHSHTHITAKAMLTEMNWE